MAQTIPTRVALLRDDFAEFSKDPAAVSSVPVKVSIYCTVLRNSDDIVGCFSCLSANFSRSLALWRGDYPWECSCFPVALHYCGSLINAEI